MSRCPFCKCDPFHYVDVGVCMAPAAVVCYDLGCDLWSHDSPTRASAARRVLRDMQSFRPRRKSRAMQALREAGLREPSRPELRAMNEVSPPRP